MLNNTKTDNSCSFNTKTDVHKSMSVRSCHSTEPQSRNPSHQMLFKNSYSVERKNNLKSSALLMFKTSFAWILLITCHYIINLENNQTKKQMNNDYQTDWKISKALDQFWDNNALTNKFFDNPSTVYRESLNQSQKWFNWKQNQKGEVKIVWNGDKDSCPSYKKLKAEYRKQHSLENTIEEYIVSNRKLQSILKQTQQQHYDLKKKHSKCEEKHKEIKEHVQNLEQKIVLLSDKSANNNFRYDSRIFDIS